MKTKEQILEYKGGDACNMLDARDKTRLSFFFAPEDWPKLGLTLKEGVDPATLQPEEYTEENVMKHLASDLSFAFDKALGKRGISAGLMWDVIKMWMWVLDDEELSAFPSDQYAQYGLPFYKAVAVKYNLPNPIGDDEGNEFEYSSYDPGDYDYAMNN